MTLNLLIVGASSGIGAAAAIHLDKQGHRLWTASRRPSAVGDWIEADISTDAGIDAIGDRIAATRLDALLFLGGTWESGAFTEAYDFHASSRAEGRNVLAVNLMAPILLVQALAPALDRADNPLIVLIGALLNCDGGASPEVANTASKFGLRGAAGALRRSLPRVGVTLVNPANVATPEVEADIREGRFGDQVPIPMADVLATLDYVLGRTSATTIAQIDLAQRHPG
ncbi:MAG: SDR family NAD(P)-dependent oxidoreductase [Inquilinaceae bacterium]